VLLQLNRQLRRELKPLGITGGQAALLHVIRSNPGIGVRELARREGMTAAGMSTALTRLEGAGLVRRTRGEQGHRVLRSARSRRTAWLAARLQRLTPEELDAVDHVIEPLAQLLDEEPA